MPSELQQHRYDAIMRRVGDLKGPGSKVAEVLSELFPVVDLENVPGELLALGGTGLAFAGTSRAPAAGQFAAMQIFNPVASGKLVTITSVYATVDTTSGLFWGVVNLPLPLASSLARFRDPRLGFTTFPVAELRVDDIGAATPINNRISLQATTPFILEDRWGVAVLPPGFGFTILPSSIDVDLQASFNWKERVAEPSELNI